MKESKQTKLNLVTCPFKEVDTHPMNLQRDHKISFLNLRMLIRIYKQFIISKSILIYLDKCQ